MEDPRKYVDSVKKTIEELKKSTDGAEDKIKSLLNVLNGISTGLLDSETKVKAALKGIETGKFKDRAILKSYIGQLGLADEAVGKLVDNWERLQIQTVDHLTQTTEYQSLMRDLNLDLEEEFKIQEDITEEQEKQTKQFEEKIDLVADLSKKYKEFSASVTSNSDRIKGINVDLTSGLSIAKKFIDSSTAIVPDLFGNADLTSGFKQYSTDFQAMSDSIGSSNPDVKLPSQKEPIKIDAVFNMLEGKNTDLIKQFETEFKLRDQLLEGYVLASLGAEGDIQSARIKNLQTGASFLDKERQSILDTATLKINTLKEVAANLQNINNLSTADQQIVHNQIALMDDQQKMLLGQYASKGVILNKNLQILNVEKQQIGLYNQLDKKLESHRDAIEQISYSFREGIIDKIPLGLQRIIGIQSASENISKAMMTSIQKYNAEVALTGNGFRSAGVAVKSFGKSIMATVGPFGLIVIAMAAIVGLAASLEGRISQISKDMGISRKEANEMQKANLQLVTSSGNRLISEEQILEIQKAQVEKNGQVLDLTKESNQQLIQTAVNASEAFGMLTTDAMEVMSTFKTIGADDALSQRLLADIGLMAEAAKISPNIIAKDLIEGAKEVSLYFSGMPKQAAKAAIQIRRMGMSIKQAGQVADKMLNIEGFMTDMTELAAMSGGKLNLSEAFDLRMQGDIEGMTKSIMGQIGSMSDFNNMSEFTQRKLANTLGMEIGDLRKSIKLKEMQNQLSTDQLALLQGNLDKVGDIENMSVENMKSKAEELNSTKKLGVALSKIKATLYKALVPMAEAFSEALSSSTGIIDAIGIGFKGIGVVIKAITPFVKGFILPFKWLGELIGWITDGINSLFGSSNKTADGIESINAGLFSASNIISTLTTTVGVLFGAKYLGKLTGISKLIGKAFSGFGGQAAAASQEAVEQLTKPSVFKTITDKFKSWNPFSFLKKKAEDIDLTKPITDQIESKKGLLSKLKDKIFGKSADPASPTTITQPSTVAQDPAASKFSKISEAIKKGIDIIKGGFQTLKDFVISTVDMISQVIGKLGEGIGKFLDSVLTGLGNGLSKFQPKALIGAAALAIISGALWVTSKAMQEFNKVEWGSLAKAGLALAGLGIALAAFGASSAIMGPGIAILIGASAAIWLFAKASESAASSVGVLFDSFGKIDIGQLLLLGPALMGIGAGLAGLGIALAAFGASSAIMGPGIAILIGASAAIWLFAKASESAASSVGVLFDSFGKIDIGQLLLLGPALMGIGAGLAGLGAGSIITGLTSLFTENPFEKLEKIALLASPMSIVANAVKSLADNLSLLTSALSSVDFNKLAELGNKTMEIEKVFKSTQIASTNNAPSIGNQTPGISPITPPTVGNYTTANQTSYSEKEGDTYNKSNTMSTAKLERLIEQLLGAFVMYANRPSYAIIDEQTSRSLNNKLKGFNNR